MQAKWRRWRDSNPQDAVPTFGSRWSSRLASGRRHRALARRRGTTHGTRCLAPSRERRQRTRLYHSPVYGPMSIQPDTGAALLPLFRCGRSLRRPSTMSRPQRLHSQRCRHQSTELSGLVPATARIPLQHDPTPLYRGVSMEAPEASSRAIPDPEASRRPVTLPPLARRPQPRPPPAGRRAPTPHRPGRAADTRPRSTCPAAPSRLPVALPQIRRDILDVHPARKAA